MMVQQNNKNRLLIIAIFGVTILPFLIALALIKNPELLGSYNNNGQLISPPITTESFDWIGVDSFSEQYKSELYGHWVLMNIVQGRECLNVCLDAIHKTRQLRLMLNKELTRTRRVVMLFKDVSLSIAEKWWVDDETLIRLRANERLIEKIIQSRRGDLSDGMLLLMDPLGNLMMQYEPGFDVYKVKADLMHLLRASQIG